MTQSEAFKNGTYEVDPELLDPKYNQARRPLLPYGIVINGNPAGILIPEDQLLKAEWRQLPAPEQLSTIELTEEVTGLLFKQCRLLILARVPEYVRWKDIEENGEQAGSFIAPYEDYRHQLNKKTQEVCSEHALVFLNSRNRPLHKVPVVVRFKNVALWSFKSARETFYRTLEKAFADYHRLEYSGKNDKWRSLGILEVKFRGVREGEGKNRSYCCKTASITPPTPENLQRLFLGQPAQKKLVWRFHRSIAGFIESNGEQLPGLSASAEPEVQVVPDSQSAAESKRQLRRIEQIGADE